VDIFGVIYGGSACEKMISQYDPSKVKDMDTAQELIEPAKPKTKEREEMYAKAPSYFNAA
jgi:hypothetical protein